MRTVASDPNPVETPYTASSDSATRATTAALRSIASRASSDSATGASCRATATTSWGLTPVGGIWTVGSLVAAGIGPRT
jgi:hypothetical protein